MDPMDQSAHRGHSAEHRRPRQRPQRRPHGSHRVTQKKRLSIVVACELPFLVLRAAGESQI